MDADRVFDRIRRIPTGFVTTYGSLTPGAPRHAGGLLAEAPPGFPCGESFVLMERLPWLQNSAEF